MAKHRKNKLYRYDPDCMYVAPDGDGGVYSYDSLEAAQEYVAKNNEDGPWSMDRSDLEKVAPYLYHMLKRIACTGGLHPDNIKKMMPEINKLLQRAEQDEHLDDILTQTVRK